MYRPGQSWAEYEEWLAAQTSTHQQRVRVRVMTLGHKVISDQTFQFVDGEVTIDVDRDVSRVLTMTLTDESRSIGWEPHSIADAPRYGSRMFRVDLLTKVPALGRWVSCPVFTGPVVDFDRSGAEVNIVAESKEWLAQGNFGHPKSWRGGWKVTSLARHILAQYAGESLFSFPSLNATTPADVTVSRADQPWAQASKLARSIDRRLEYDATGRAWFRVPPRRPVLTIPSRWLTAPVAIDRQSGDFHNRWIVQGAVPAGSQKRITADVVLPPSHPLSAQALGRDGVPHWRTHVEDNPQIKTHTRALQIGRRRRDNQARNIVGLTVECLPLPHLQEWDIVRVVDPTMGSVWVRVTQATIPLDGSPMTIGSIKRTRTTGQARRAANRRRSKYSGRNSG